MTGTRVRRPTKWLPATVASIRVETPRVRSIRFTVSGWPGHVPGQHADVRLAGPSGYRAERSYSLACPAECGVELTVERLDDGEVSRYLTESLQPGQVIDLRGPVGGHFVWDASAARRPLLLVAGGSGIVPLMCMLRHRSLSGSAVPTGVLYSCRTRDEVIYSNELADMARRDAGLRLWITLTRESPHTWEGGVGRITVPLVRALRGRLGDVADTFVCGSDGFVETASEMLLQAGQPADTIRTERFGATGH